MIHHGPQPIIANRLVVDAAHVRNFVAHDKIRRRLVLDFIGDGAESVAKGVKAEPFAAIDAQRL
jgi:hypothetical protein